MAATQRLEERRGGTGAGPGATGDAPSQRRVASYRNYAEAERAVDWLSDRGFPVERVAIVGTGLRSVEQVTGRVTGARAGLAGSGEGALIGVLFAILFGIFFSGPEFAGLLLYSVVAGAVFGALFGVLEYEFAGGDKRGFVSASDIEPSGYEIQVDEPVAGEAERLLATRTVTA